MFADRLNEIMTLCGAKNREIAAFAGYDPSTLTHLRKGSRSPSPVSPTVKKTVKGIYLYMSDSGRLKDLTDLLEIPEDTVRSRVLSSLIRWLFDGITSDKKRSGKKKNSSVKTSNRFFAERFNAVMDLAKLSNLRFSQIAHVDPSVVSRYRNGIHSPRRNSDMALHFSMTLWNRINDLDRIPALSELTGISEGSLTESLFYNWLYDTDDFISDDSNTEKLLSAFASFTMDNAAHLPGFENIATDEILNSINNVYFGYEGLREAVIRFLGNAVKHGSKELLLYSDQNMDWMTGDREYFMKWASLMSSCVKGGTRIKIIHNINRGLDEMCDAIISWLPLYISGMIESFYCTTVNTGQFSHTLFLNPGEACIKAMNVIGNEPNGIYHYYDSDPLLDLCKKDFLKMLDKSRSLVRIFSSDSKFKDDYEEYKLYNLNLLLGKKKVRISRNTAPLISIEFSHPLMCRAFQEFVNRQKKQSDQ